ncbi:MULTISPECIES: DUF3613 domain-containing protein [Achromobacter]|uniref:DUF3613 domain-containing protein n=1 Tax=Achromobacter spanius TaxID=217203 RepID=A0ABY8H0F9_9BURK|nr:MULTISPECIES: DUF3613 domain-containing protein [Achromobacter]WAI85996.1 DUF3613 domain-containing protein [Achromobacter spanius]WEX96077.1 DUF3613 domain-containing protein [Achromobacter sp. SS2-2022]WFP10204.1 DUF3613 domain-containing protein [Achromobacter spanius]
MSDSRYSASQVLTAALATTLMALAPLTSQAQSNAPLTGGMTSSPPAAAPAQALPQAQLPARPVVQQVQTPMPQPAASAAASTQVAQPAQGAQPAAPAEEAFGDVTRGLLAAQADGRRAGNMLPVLGPVSTAAWNRYLESFSHPIPEFLQKRVETKNTN